jgi:hypothetical protein
MKAWIRSPREPAALAEHSVDELMFICHQMMFDIQGKTSVRLNLFYDVVSSQPQKRVVEVINDVLDANDGAWWLPFLFDSYTAPLIAPVADRLVAVARRHWPEAVRRNLTWELGCRTEQIVRPFNGLIQPGEPESWLLEHDHRMGKSQ